MGHHFVPQRYLRGFQTNENKDLIWMYDKNAKTAKRLPIDRVAQVPGFYSDDVESALNVEAEIQATTSSIRSGQEKRQT
jgi:hypothetical protein